VNNLSSEPTQIKRIRESAPFRKSMSMSEGDIEKASELERMFGDLYPEEKPFTFSKTISKALEIAYDSLQKPEFVPKPAFKPVEKPRTTRKPKIGNVRKKH